MKERIKKTIKNILILYKKYLIAVIYAITAFIVFQNRDTIIYSHIPFIQGIPILITICNIILFIIATTGFFALVALLHCPPHHKRKFQRAMERNKLYNKLANGKTEYPKLKSVYIDRSRKHGLIYNVKNYGVAVPNFDEKMEGLKASLGCRIYNIEPAKGYKRILLYLLPFRYAKPTVISLRNPFLWKKHICEVENALLVGNTGSGKTIAIKVLMSLIVKHIPHAHIWVLDHKEQDFKAFSDCPRYYKGKECVNGLNDFYTAFEKQRSKGTGQPNFLIIDELGAFLLSQDRKTKEQSMTKLGEILMLGRSYQYVCIAGMQRADASYFPNGSRDNYKNIIALGNLSKEQKNMLFPDYKEYMTDNNKSGYGYIFIDGEGLEPIQIERIQDMQAFDESIQKAILENNSRLDVPDGGAESETV